MCAAPPCAITGMHTAVESNASPISCPNSSHGRSVCSRLSGRVFRRIASLKIYHLTTARRLVFHPLIYTPWSPRLGKCQVFEQCKLIIWSDFPACKRDKENGAICLFVDCSHHRSSKMTPCVEEKDEALGLESVGMITPRPV